MRQWYKGLAGKPISRYSVTHYRACRHIYAHRNVLPSRTQWLNRYSQSDGLCISCQLLFYVIHYIPIPPTPNPSVFSWQMIDGQALLLLTQTDIVKILCIKLGPAVKIYNSILMFKNTEDSTDWLKDPVVLHYQCPISHWMPSVQSKYDLLRH